MTILFLVCILNLWLTVQLAILISLLDLRSTLWIFVKFAWSGSAKVEK